MTTKILRVGVMNNFNFTEAETNALKEFEDEYPLLFVNSNSYVNIKADYPSILTVNPYLDYFAEPQGDLSNVRACRIKVVSRPVDSVDTAVHKAIQWCMDNSIPMLFTFQRFACRKSLEAYTWDPCDYEFRGNYFRLRQKPREELRDALLKEAGDQQALVNFCDWKEEGCPACGNCAKLGAGVTDGDVEMYGLNLSASGDQGDCLFHCPDCFARSLKKFRKVSYDTVTRNSKMKGRVKH